MHLCELVLICVMLIYICGAKQMCAVRKLIYFHRHRVVCYSFMNYQVFNAKNDVIDLLRLVSCLDLKETSMVPTAEGSTSLQCESTYTFRTECFFMTHYCLHIGFRVLHERLVKLNQEVHRIQQVYQDIARQSLGGSDAVDRLKEDMERGQQQYLPMLFNC